MLILQSQETETLILKSQCATRLTMEIEYRIDIWEILRERATLIFKSQETDTLILKSQRATQFSI